MLQSCCENVTRIVKNVTRIVKKCYMDCEKCYTDCENVTTVMYRPKVFFLPVLLPVDVTSNDISKKSFFLCV